MSQTAPRIAPLEPPYAPDIAGQFDRIMRGAPPLVLFRVMAGNARAWEKFRAGSLLDRGPLVVTRARDRHRPHLRANRVRVRMGRACRDVCGSRAPDRRTGPRHRARRRHGGLLVGGRAGADRGRRRAARPRDAERRRIRGLSAHYDEAQIFEIILLCGFYRTVSYLANGLALPLEEKAARFPK